MLFFLTVLAVILVVGGAGAALAAWLYIRKLRGMVLDFITPAAEGQPSALAGVVESVASMFARATTAQIKASLMGIESGATRAQKAIDGDIAVDLAGQLPLGSLLESFPTLRKTLKRNPQLLDLAMGALQRLGQGRVQDSTAMTAGSNGRPKFSL